jgi:hypothetical protein
MADRVTNGPVESPASIREAVCVNTRKIYDSCRDKDCVDDLRVYPTESSQAYIENALNIRPKSAKLLNVDVSVEPVSFNRGYYTVDCTYFYRVTGETFPNGQTVQGLAVFDKRAMLFGSEGSVKTFTSDGEEAIVSLDDQPRAVVSAVDPIALHASLADPAETPGSDNIIIPAFILDAMGEDLITVDNFRRWFVTIGQFSMVRLERETQLLIPAYDYFLPDKECPGTSEDDPCALFGRIDFPVDEFFPPDSAVESNDYKQYK